MLKKHFFLNRKCKVLVFSIMSRKDLLYIYTYIFIHIYNIHTYTYGFFIFPFHQYFMLFRALSINKILYKEFITH